MDLQTIPSRRHQWSSLDLAVKHNFYSHVIMDLLLVASLLLVVRPGAPSSVLVLKMDTSCLHHDMTHVDTEFASRSAPVATGPPGQTRRGFNTAPLAMASNLIAMNSHLLAASITQNISLEAMHLFPIAYCF